MPDSELVTNDGSVLGLAGKRKFLPKVIQLSKIQKIVESDQIETRPEEEITYQSVTPEPEENFNIDYEVVSPSDDSRGQENVEPAVNKNPNTLSPSKVITDLSALTLNQILRMSEIDFKNYFERKTTRSDSSLTTSPVPSETPPSQRKTIPRVSLKNGKLVVEEDSVVQNQPATPAKSATPKKKSIRNWNAGETNEFYLALRLFGTDFQKIADFLKDRKRDNIKNKYKKEAKVNAILIDYALTHRFSFDLEEVMCFSK